MNRYTKQALLSILVLGSLIPAVHAEPSALSSAAPAAQSRWNKARPSGAFGYLGRLEKTLGLSPEQRDAVRGLMADQRRQTQAIRETTDTKIRSLLNVEQVKKFDVMKAQEKERRAARAQ